MLVIVSVALTDPTVCGLKVIVKGTLVPAAIVTGSESPPRLNTELLVLAAVTVTFAPVAARVPEVVPLVPSSTLPRARVVGLIASCPAAAAPVPDKGIVRVGFDPFDVTVTVPLALPDVVGANFTLMTTLCPAASVIGVPMAVDVNPVPVVAT